MGVKPLAFRCFVRLVHAAVLLLAFNPALAHAQAAAAPDTIFFHGDVLTGSRLRPGDTSTMPARVTALAVREGKIVAVGPDKDVLALKGASTQLIDLHGAFTVPGFNDAHTHMASAGQQRLTVDLDNVPSLAAMQEKIKSYAATLPAGAWITGGGWDHTKWASRTLPTRQDLDTVTGGHPAYLERTDGHISVANSAALEAAHITAATKAPTGGQIDLDPATHQPTGIVRDAALPLLRNVIPKPDEATRRRALAIAIQDALAHGVTSVQDFSDYEDFRALEAMERDGQLPIRFSEWMPFDLPVAQLKQYQASHPQTDPYLHTGMLKGFMDGSLGSRTAALLAPYSDDPGNSGLPRYDQKKLNTMAAERAEAGFQLGFHAIGDRANSMALDAFAYAESHLNAGPGVAAGFSPRESHQQKNGALAQADSAPRNGLPSRFRIEHAQVLAPADFDRFTRLHVIASMQPSHLLTDMAWAGARLGPERSKHAYAWRSFLNHGVTLAFGTDYPVESINPFRGLYSAITRRNEAGTQTFEPQEKLTIQEALYAYTQASAFAENMEKQKGRLEPGYFADFAVLDRDITRVTPQSLLHARVLRTVVGGKTVYGGAPWPAVHATTPAIE